MEDGRIPKTCNRSSQEGTSLPKLSFVNWYSVDIRSTATFYEQFGIVFPEEQHGAGPVHFALHSNGLAIELYPAKEGGIVSTGADTLIGFEVANVDEAGLVAEGRGLDIIERVKTTAMGRRVILRDPDGRQVFLFSPTP